MTFVTLIFRTGKFLVHNGKYSINWNKQIWQRSFWQKGNVYFIVNVILELDSTNIVAYNTKKLYCNRCPPPPKK